MKKSAFFSSLGFMVAALVTTGASSGSAPVVEAAWNPVPMYTTHPEVFSGLSGPGHPVVGDGYGGYRTGRDGTMYKGLDPAKPGWLDLGDRAKGTAVTNGVLPPLRPIWELHLRDTTICLGGDGNYYMTGSSGDNIWDRVDGVELWRSPDLQHWDYLGMVWSMAKDATWQKRYRYIWAPQIVYLKKLNTYCIALCWGPNGGTGILESTTGKPEGPYVNPMKPDERIGGGIDSALFEDDDGSVYYTNGGGGTIRKLKPDLSGFDGPPITVTYSDGSHTGSPAKEGASLFKANGLYHIGGAEFIDAGGSTRYSSTDAVADNIAGPYRGWHEGVPCGGGGNYFQDKQGNWWCTYFGNDDQSPWREKPGIVKIEFDAKGLIHIAKKQPDFVLAESARNGQSPWSDSPPAPTKAASGPPILGWSSWSNTWTASGQKLTEAYVEAQADVMAAKLKSSGFVYINLDDGWSRGFDENGRLQPNLRNFPDGISGLADYLHKKGLKLGVYLKPGLMKQAWQENGTVAGTQIHLRDIADTAVQGNTEGDAYHIDYTKPGAVEYIQSYADMLASWGVDYIKFDFVGPGGGKVKADTREDVQQWQAALKKTGRPIWLELSNYLSFAYADFWKAQTNGWRIENDIENYGKDGHLTRWAKVAVRFNDVPKWAPYADTGGWNDLDSLEIGNGDADGISVDERKSMMTLWAISCSPLIIGADLTKLDDGDLAILTNPEVLAVDQAGHAATPLDQSSKQQVWRVKNPDGSFTVALFNLGDAEAKVSVSWQDLGITGAAAVRDLWEHKDLGKFDTSYDATLATHACQLLRIQP